MTHWHNKNTKPIHMALAIGWFCFGLIGIFTGLQRSIPVLFFISVYANFVGHLSAVEATKAQDSNNSSA